MSMNNFKLNEYSFLDSFEVIQDYTIAQRLQKTNKKDVVELFCEILYLLITYKT